MKRSRASAKSAGTRFETDVATYLRAHIDDGIERRRLSGSQDRGDLSGWKYAGQRIVAELKDYAGVLHPGPWLREVDVERVNDDADVGLVIAKRRGVSDPGDQFVLMSLRDLVSLLNGYRPSNDDPWPEIVDFTPSPPPILRDDPPF